MASDLLKLRRYLEDLILRTGGASSTGGKNLSAWFERHRFQSDGLMSKSTFQNFFSKEVVPSLESVLALTQVVNRARSTINEPPISPRTIAELHPVLQAKLAAFEGGLDLDHIEEVVPTAKLRKLSVLATFKDLPLDDRREIAPELIRLCVDAIDLANLYGLTKIAWIFREINRREAKGWPTFWDQHFPGDILPYKSMLEIAEGEMPSKPLSKKAYGAIVGFLENVSYRLPVKVNDADLEALKQSVKRA
jgi:hypothetical protein